MKKYWYILIPLFFLGACGMEQDYAASEEVYDTEAEASAEEAEAEAGDEGPKNDVSNQKYPLNIEHQEELNIIKKDLKRRLEEEQFYTGPSIRAFAKEIKMDVFPFSKEALSNLNIEEKHDNARFQYLLVIGSNKSRWKAKYQVQFEDLEEGDLEIKFIELYQINPRSSDQSPSK